MLGAKTVQVARAAESLGMTVPQFVKWSRDVDEALAKRGGVTLDEWQRSRDSSQRPAWR